MSKHIEVVIKEIISDRGAEVLNEPKVFCSMLDDLIPEDINSRTILRRTLISYPEISNSIYSLLIVDVPQKEQIRKLEFLMKNNYGISIEWTQAVLFYFGFATSPTVSVSTENKTDSVTSKESNDKNKTAPSDSIFYDNIICGDKDYVFGVTETNEVISCGSGGEDYSRLIVETVKKWKNILYIYKAWSLEYGFLLIGLQTNGSVVAVSSNKSDPRLACQKWTDITSISAGYYHVVGVKSDGTVVACGENRFGKCDVSGWNNIKSVQAFHTWTLGIKNDGNIVWTGDKKTLGSFSDIDSVNNLFVLGIKKDKTLAIADDFYTWKSHDPTDWLYSLNNIKKVASSYGTIVVLFENGTVAGDNYKVGNIESVKNWKNIIDIVTDGEYVVGLCEDGTLNTLRFLFSKWTLKEGWDNPNVFTIAKLRSSGSENSKLQEVGRGLRLPVDENGNRISNEEFTLNYIVDFTEADFAQKLVDQINGELPQTAIISEEKLNAVAKKIGKSSDSLFDELYDKRYIDRHLNIKPETRDLFFAEYPDFATGLSAGKVKDRNKDKPRPVKIRKAVYNEIKELWETINHRYLLFYDNDLNDNLDDVLLKLFEKPGVFTDLVMRSDRDVVESNGAEMNAIRETGVQYVIHKTIPYNVFLKRISSATNLPIKVLHTALTKYAQNHGTEFTAHINENTVAGFCAEFSAWKNDNLQGRFRYERSKAPLGATALTYADGTVRSEISQGRIGTKIVPGTPSDKYLYDSYAYDSPLEKDNIYVCSKA